MNIKKADITNTKKNACIILNVLTDASASLGVFRYKKGVKSILKPQ
jgi:hypothetical protein